MSAVDLIISRFFKFTDSIEYIEFYGYSTYGFKMDGIVRDTALEVIEKIEKDMPEGFELMTMGGAKLLRQYKNGRQEGWYIVVRRKE